MAWVVCSCMAWSQRVVRWDDPIPQLLQGDGVFRGNAGLPEVR